MIPILRRKASIAQSTVCRTIIEVSELIAENSELNSGRWSISIKNMDNKTVWR